MASVSLRRADIELALAALPECERQVIELRFGLHGGRPRTLDKGERSFGLTPERIGSSRPRRSQSRMSTTPYRTGAR